MAQREVGTDNKLAHASKALHSILFKYDMYNYELPAALIADVIGIGLFGLKRIMGGIYVKGGGF